MIGKRVIMLKRPAVLCAAVFVVGIVLAKFSVGVAFGGAGGLLFCGMLFFRGLQKGKRRISAMDKVLCLVPAFLLLGYFVMSRAQATYEQNRQTFSECLREGRELLAEGTVSYIGLTATGVRLELKDAKVTSYNGNETAYRPVGRLLLYAEDMEAENGEVKYGQRIFVYGNGSEFEPAPNPGGFDAKTYYFSLGITGAVQGKTLRIRDFSYQRLNQALFQAKSKLLDSYVTYLGEDNAGVISSMLLGERSLLSDETQELYRRGGISHVLAISGLHVSLIGMALYEFLRKTVLGRNGAIPVACAGVFLYGTFVEAGTSTKRAVIMFLLLLLATALGRTYDTLSAMSVSAVVILCQSPGALYTASFQLSFAAAYGASVLAMLLKEQTEKTETCLENGGRGDGTELGKGSAGIEAERVTYGSGEYAGIETARRVAIRENCRWVRIREYVTSKLKEMFLFGLAIQVVTFPFTVFHFFEYSTYGFLLNPLVVPLMTILLLCGFLSGVCGLCIPWPGYFFAGGARGILWIYNGLCRFVQKLPGALLLFGKPEVWQMAVYFFSLAVCLYFWKIRAQRTVILSQKVFTELQAVLGNVKVMLGILILLPLCLLPLPCAPFEATFLDVGQGDGILLRERGGAVLLVDGGSSSVQKVGEKRMIPYIKSQGIRVISCAFVSHTDSDHISGIKEILDAMPECKESNGRETGLLRTGAADSYRESVEYTEGNRYRESVEYTEGNGYRESVEECTERNRYRESVWGYTGTPIIKRIVLPKMYPEPEGVILTNERFDSDGNSKAQKSKEGFIQDKAYAELVKSAKEKGVEVYYMDAGDCMKVGKNMILSCLAPEEDVTYSDKNAASMVLKVSYEEFDLLLTGDMDRDGEQRLLEKGALVLEKDSDVSDGKGASEVSDGNASEVSDGKDSDVSDGKGASEVSNGNASDVSDGKVTDVSDENATKVPDGKATKVPDGEKETGIEVLKVAHHGSYTASSKEFITMLRPEIAVISCGKNNRYGHPHKETLERLSEAGSRVYRTDESGCVTVKVKKRGGYEVDCRLKSD